MVSTLCVAFAPMVDVDVENEQRPSLDKCVRAESGGETDNPERRMGRNQNWTDFHMIGFANDSSLGRVMPSFT